MLTIVSQLHLKGGYRQSEAQLSHVSVAVFVLWLCASILYPRYLAIDIAGLSITLLNVIYLFVLSYALGLLAVRPLLRQRILTRVLNAPVLYALITLTIVWQALCDIIGTSPATSLGLSCKYWVNITSGFYLSSVFLQDARCRRLFRRTLLLGILIVCTIGVQEKIAGQSFLRQFHLQEIASNADVVAIYTSGGARDGMFRAASLFTHPIVFGQFAAASFIMSLGAAIYARGNLRKIGLFLALLVPAAVYASGSRSASVVLLASFAIGLALLVLNKNSPVSTLVGALLGSVFCMLLYWTCADYFHALIVGRSVVEVGSSNARTLMIQNGLSAIQSSPLFGFGAGMSLVMAGFGSGLIRTIDNWYLTTLLDFGYGGLAITLGAYAAVLVYGYKAGVKLQGNEERWFAASLTAFCAGILIGQYVLSIYDNLFYVHIFAGYFACIATSENSAVVRTRRRERPGSSRRLQISL